MSQPPNSDAGDAFHLHPDSTSQDRETLDAVFKDGVEARRTGLALSDNPYAAGSEKRAEWTAGWSATVEIEDEDLPAKPGNPV